MRWSSEHLWGEACPQISADQKYEKLQQLMEDVHISDCLPFQLEILSPPGSFNTFMEKSINGLKFMM